MISSFGLHGEFLFPTGVGLDLNFLTSIAFDDLERSGRTVQRHGLNLTIGGQRVSNG
jgi:hypothetical protein